MPWYRFWKKSGPMSRLAETFRHYDGTPSEAELKCDSESWADKEPGGQESRYTWGFEPVDYPPMAWLNKKAVGARALMVQLEQDIQFYCDEIARYQRSKDNPVTVDKEEGT